MIQKIVAYSCRVCGSTNIVKNGTNRLKQQLVTDYLVEKVWGYGYEGNEKLIRQAIHRLRKKIEQDPRNPIYIQTRPGLGYMFFPPS